MPRAITPLWILGSILWNIGGPLHPRVWKSMAAVGWNLNQDSQAEHIRVISRCGLDFLLRRVTSGESIFLHAGLGSKSKCDSEYATFYQSIAQFTANITSTTILIGPSAYQTCPGARGGSIDSPSKWRNCQRICSHVHEIPTLTTANPSPCLPTPTDRLKAQASWLRSLVLANAQGANGSRGQIRLPEPF